MTNEISNVMVMDAMMNEYRKNYDIVGLMYRSGDAENGKIDQDISRC